MAEGGPQDAADRASGACRFAYTDLSWLTFFYQAMAHSVND
jgi:hypothetical protein